MKGYEFKTEEEKNIFHAFIIEKQNDIDMFDFINCVGVRFTIQGDLHLLKNVDYNSLDFVENLNDFILMCN